jgi:hypothetical protein
MVADVIHTNLDEHCVHPFRVINSKAKQNVSLYGKDYDAQLELCSDYLLLLSLRESCINRANGSRRLLKCNCFAFLSTPLHSEAVGLWMVDFNKLEKEGQQCAMMEKIRHADDLDKAAPHKNRRNQNLPKLIYHLPFIMPEDDDEDKDKDSDDEVGEDGANATILNGHRICQSAMMEIIGVRHGWWGTCRKHIQLGTPPVHRLKGKASNRKRKFAQEEEADLIDYFMEIKDLGEPSATRFVAEKIGELSTRDNDVDVTYLPPSWSKRNLYQRYAVSRGWDATTNNIGDVIKSARVGEEQKRLCSWAAFYYYWKSNFPKLRVRRRIEDICSQCYIFQNTYKYRRNKQTSGDNNNPPNESDESDEDDDNLAPDVTVADDDADVDPEVLANEEKIVKAAKHVTMAHAMRVLFRLYMKMATANDIEQSFTLLVAD